MDGLRAWFDVDVVFDEVSVSIISIKRPNVEILQQEGESGIQFICFGGTRCCLA